MAAPR
jgi:hypothetical protein